VPQACKLKAGKFVDLRFDEAEGYSVTIRIPVSDALDLSKAITVAVRRVSR
jgi:hypothetical protein